MAAGLLLIGVAAWPLVAPAVPNGAITVQAGDISVWDTLIVVTLGFVVGLLGYFLAWPYGADIGVLAAPAGLALWSMRSGSMASILRLNIGPNVEQTLLLRQKVFAAMQWEALLWFAVVAAGFAGVSLAARHVPAHRPVRDEDIGNTNSRNPFNIAAALLASVVIAQFAMAVFAQDVRMFDSKLGSVIGQPGRAQIAFAVFVSFAIAAFIVKRFLDVSWLAAAASTVGLAFYAVWLSGKRDVLEHMIETWPEAFFSRSICAILPIQIVAFGAIGAVTGYWFAIKYDWWRKHSQ